MLEKQLMARSMLAYCTKPAAQQKTYTLGLKSALSGRAWIQTQKRPGPTVVKLLEAGAAELLKTVQDFIDNGRAPCEKAAPIRKEGGLGRQLLS